MFHYCGYQVTLPEPKTMSLRVTLNKDKLNKIKNIIENIITNQAKTDLSKLYDEGALISRMCCKVKKKFRGEKLFRRLKQISVSIKKLHQLNIQDVILILLSTFENGMPTKQAGEWAGTRILAAAYLIAQLQEFSKGIAQLIVKVLHNGQCWLEINIALGMISRVWILAKSLQKSFLLSYRNYRPLVNQLKSADTDWPTNFELPENLTDNLLEQNNNESEEEFGNIPGSVMRRKPEPEDQIIKKRKRPGKQIRILQKKYKHDTIVSCN